MDYNTLIKTICLNEIGVSLEIMSYTRSIFRNYSVGSTFKNYNRGPPLGMTAWGPQLQKLQCGTPYVNVDMSPTIINYNIRERLLTGVVSSDSSHLAAQCPEFKPWVDRLFLLVRAPFPLVWAFFPHVQTHFQLEWVVFPCVWAVCWILRKKL